ncbi:MAG: STM4012 family radical SAM protein, partial [Gemmatimonadaceae bacterium]|nr:STM4012 family radical SAM protein [Gemmatimonadaceae bacterium]
MTARGSHPVLADSPYVGYVYAYPHKTAYRPLAPTPLAGVWAGEPRDRLSLYVHVPFCTMRCGFCNLFTTANPAASLMPPYLDALRRQAEAVRAAVPDARFAQFAIGGGTPTYLTEAELETVFDLAETVMGVDPASVGTSVEASPDTLSAGKVALLAGRNVERVSLGVQSFVDAEVRQSGRSQSRAEVEAALGLLIGRFPTVNVDLIYGLPEQTVESWLESVRIAAAFGPEELYLYPLYVRPLTGLGKSAKRWDDWRLSCYREARALLLDAGYRQVSMRMFRKGTDPKTNPVYCCQVDGMIGLGSGARSYARELHYSFEYAVAAGGVRGIIADYLARRPEEFARADYGFELDGDERRRRYLLQSVLNADGLDVSRYRVTFGTAPTDDFPDLL